jgi:zinc protease
MRETFRTAARVLFALGALVAWVPAVGALQQAPLVAVPADARTAPLDQLTPVSPDVTVGELPNGLRYYIRENDEPENRAQFRLVVRVGSVVEDGDQLGLAHVLEHMAFNGTENFEKQELLNFMESIGMRLGAGVNASTDFDVTNYQLEVPMDNPEHLATAFQIMEDWAHGLRLDPVEVDQERDVVIEEWRMRRGVEARLMDQQFPIIFQGSRYAERLPIGTVESIETFEHDALVRFYRDWYRPDLMGIVAVGDFDAAQIEGLIRQHFADIEVPAGARERPEYPIPGHDETLYSVLSDPELTSTSVTIYHKMDSNWDWTVGGYRQALVEAMYNGMLNDRFREIALEPDAPFLGASSSNGHFVGDTDVYVLAASVVDGGVEEGIAAILTEAERVLRFGFTESELERQKVAELRAIEQAYVQRADRSSASYAGEYIRAFLNGESIPGIEYEYELYRRFIPEITLDDVNAVAQSWVLETNRVVLVTGPESETTPLPNQFALEDVIFSVVDQDISPYEDALSDAELLPVAPLGSTVTETVTLERGITEWRLGNGVRVVLKPTDFDEDQVAFRAFSPGGTSLAPDELFIPATTADEVVSGGGLAEFDQVELDRLLTGTVARVSPFISELEEGVAGSASTADLETLFQLIYLTFTQPRADEDFFAVWSAQMRQALENRDADPATAWSDRYQALMTGDHPRARPMDLAALDRADLEASFDFYRDRFSDASDFTFVFVGSFDPEAIRPLVETYLGGLPSTGRTETWRDLGIRPPTGVIEEVVERGLEPQSQTIVTFSGPFEYADQSQRSVIRALALVLESRLMESVREELGGTYSIGAGPGLTWRPEEAYQFNVVFGSDPDRVDELLGSIFEGIAALKADGPTEEQTAAAKETLLRQFETDFQENGPWLNQLVSDYQRGVEPGAATDTFNESVRALTSESIRLAAERYLDTSNYVRVTLLPE